jgi:hypothetical protein
LIDADVREAARIVVSDTICERMRDQSRPLSAFIVEELERAGFLRKPPKRERAAR